MTAMVEIRRYANGSFGSKQTRQWQVWVEIEAVTAAHMLAPLAVRKLWTSFLD